MEGKTVIQVGPPSSASLGRLVRFHRRAARLTQLGLARAAGVGKTAVFDVEHGKATVRVDTLAAVLGVLNIALRIEAPLAAAWGAAEAAEAAERP